MTIIDIFVHYMNLFQIAPAAWAAVEGTGMVLLTQQVSVDNHY